MKAYDNSKSDFGSLYLPSEKFLCYLTLCEDIFANDFLNLMHMEKVKMRLCNKILHVVDGTWFTENNTCCSNLTVIVNKYVTVRIHNCLKFFNDSISKQPPKKANRKTLKVCHL